ncbi:kinase-like domain-containing protein [Mycena rosella]|uniref:non-specific serine/threonine protein kinase n=1 Tax=Mycena rosella TaxID=1033263 RepID=A0AAD7G7F5_MYCRO|nr:kinase-like domain-containing protein [Mycena rosella]
MLQTEHTTPAIQTLADLSRNASVISTSSTDSEQEVTPPPRPRPIRTFSAPRSRSPQSPTTRGASRPPPSYLSRELGYTEPSPPLLSVPNGRPTSVPQPPGKPSLRDFQFGSTLGEGSYSTVNNALRCLFASPVLVKLGTSRIDGKQYAIKVITKSHLIRAHKVETAAAERKALIRLHGHPGIVSLFHAFQDEWSLYFVIDLAANGEMQSLISRLGSLSTRCVQYYAAQIADAIEYMHSKGVIHRDLKPENLLLDDAFRIKITDFGTGKVLENGEKRATTFVGTAQYQAPELLELKETTTSSDYWAFGCVLYQMIAGRFAFSDRSDYLTWQKVKKVEYEFPSGFDDQAKDLVQKLLVHDPLKRLGAGPGGSSNDPSALKAHAFFSSIVWKSLWTDPAPPIEPGLVRKEHPLAQGHDGNWEDVGATWDEIAGNEDSDGIEWSSDAEGPPRHNGLPSPHATDIGPKDEIKLSAFPLVQDVVRARSVSNDPSRDGSSSSSHESSSGNTADRLRDSMERLEIRSSGRSSPDGPARRDAIRLERERGRDRAPTPLRNNEPDPPDFATALKLLDGETILFDSPVEARTPRRRASRILLPIGGTPVKSKRRHLVLTNRRLFCLKPNMSIKSEVVFQPSDKGKDKGKDSRGVVSTVELRGERELIVMASSKTFIYGILYPFSAAVWAEKINNVLTTEAVPESIRT